MYSAMLIAQHIFYDIAAPSQQSQKQAPFGTLEFAELHVCRNEIADRLIEIFLASQIDDFQIYLIQQRESLDGFVLGQLKGDIVINGVQIQLGTGRKYYDSGIGERGESKIVGGRYNKKRGPSLHSWNGSHSSYEAAGSGSSHCSQ